MQTALIVLFVLVVLTAVISLGLFHWQYRSWPPRVWAERVIIRLDSLRDRRRQLVGHRNTTQTAIAELYDKHFRRHLRGIAVETLTEYPGIGPATVERIRDAGYSRVGDITEVRFDTLAGIGPTRTKALREAVRKLVRDARGRFDAGACPEAQEYRRRAVTLKANDREQAEARVRELAAVEDALAETTTLYDLAKDVSFWAYLFHHEVPGITDEVMDTPLPTPVETPVPVAIEPVRPAAPAAPAVPVGHVPQAAKPVEARAPAPPTPPPVVNPLPAWVRDNIPVEAPHPWLAKMRAITRFAFVIAKADGRVAQAERKAIRAFLEQKFGHDGVLVRHIDPLMEHVEAAVPTEAEAVTDIRLVTTDAERRELYAWAERIADAAGERNQREQDTLERLAAAFDLKRPPMTPASAPPTAPPPVAPPVASVPEPVEAKPEPVPQPQPPAESAPVKKLRAYARFAASVGRSMNRVGPAEVAVIRAFLESKFKRSTVTRGHIEPILAEALAAPPPEAEVIPFVRSITNGADKLELHQLAERIAVASAPPDRVAWETLARVAASFDLPAPPTPPAAPVGLAEPEPLDPRAVLEIDRDTPLSPELIRRRFALLGDKLDPAKAAALGPEFARLAEEKRTALRAAAEALMAPFGEPLEKPAAEPPPADIRHNPDLDDIFGG